MNNETIPVRRLLRLSRKLTADPFAPSDNIYSLLTLSLLTVNKYSTKYKHLKISAQIELAITFLPDLLEDLVGRETIDRKTALNLKKILKKQRSSLNIILQNYLLAARELKINQKASADSMDKKCMCLF